MKMLPDADEPMHCTNQWSMVHVAKNTKTEQKEKKTKSTFEYSTWKWKQSNSIQYAEIKVMRLVICDQARKKVRENQMYRMSWSYARSAINFNHLPVHLYWIADSIMDRMHWKVTVSWDSDSESNAIHSFTLIDTYIRDASTAQTRSCEHQIRKSHSSESHFVANSIFMDSICSFTVSAAFFVAAFNFYQSPYAFCRLYLTRIVHCWWIGWKAVPGRVSSTSPP